MTKKDLKPGHVYRAKEPRRAGGWCVNDRRILNISAGVVRYVGPAFRNGVPYPTVALDVFLEWAGEDVTDQYTGGQVAGQYSGGGSIEWMDWNVYKKTKAKK